MSRGQRTPASKARSSQNPPKHGLRAQKYVVLPQEDVAEFKALEAALIAQLALVGALQTVLARRVAGRRVAPRARRSVSPPERGRGPVAGRERVGAPFPNQSGDAQPGGQQAEVLEFRSYQGAGPGIALMRVPRV